MRRPLLGRIACAVTGSAAASRSCREAEPFSSSSRSSCVRNAASVPGKSRSSSAARMYSPNRPRAPVLDQPAEHADRVTANPLVLRDARSLCDVPDIEQVMRHTRPLVARHLRGANVHAPIQSVLSALMTSPSRVRASSMARSDFPAAVGPTIATTLVTTRPRRRRSMRRRRETPSQQGCVDVETLCCTGQHLPRGPPTHEQLRRHLWVQLSEARGRHRARVRV